MLMSSRASRWPGDDHPLSRYHGGTAKAAVQAIKAAKIAEANRRFQMGREAAQKMRAKAVIAQDSAPKPRKDRVRIKAPAPLPPRSERVTLWHCRKGPRLNPELRSGDRPRNIVQIRVRKIALRIAQRNICALCGKELGAKVSLDHCIPVSAKGPDAWGNLVLAHSECNARKGNDRPTGCELVWLYFVNAKLGPMITKELLSA